jgi:hypothetical protein
MWLRHHDNAEPLSGDANSSPRHNRSEGIWHHLSDKFMHGQLGRSGSDLEQEAADRQRELEAAEFLFRSGLIADSDRALFEEFAAICDGPGRPVEDGTPESRKKLSEWLAAQPKFALCLSGGGIRSAAFCMGALRALARNKLLSQFHYLSTVSGGGYIGGWLLHLVKLKNYSLEKAAEVLAGSQALPEIKNLRDFTNFLAPTPGLLSGDVLAGGVLYLRNLIVNWMMFLPALMALALIPTVYRDVICAVAPQAFASPGLDVRLEIALGTFVVGLIALGWSVFHACLYIPSHAYDIAWKRSKASADTKRNGIGRNDAGQPETRQSWQEPELVEYGRPIAEIMRNVVLPVFIWAMLAPVCFAALSPPPEALMPPVDAAYAAFGTRNSLDFSGVYSRWLLISIPMATAVVMFGTYMAAERRVLGSIRQDKDKVLHRKVFVSNRLKWLFGCVASALAIWAVLLGGIYARAEEIASFGPLLILIAHVQQTTFYIAVRRGAPRADLDREWLARLNAYYLISGCAFAVGAACSLILPYWFLSGAAGLHQLGAVFGLVSGPVAATLVYKTTAILKSREGLATSLGLRLFNVVTCSATLLFAVILIALLSWGGQTLVCLVTEDLFLWAGWGSAPWWADALGTVIFIFVLGRLIAWPLGRVINVNRFSMHSVYRNRIVRAFLGSSRPPEERRPDSLVRFDPDDNLRMSELSPEKFSNRPVRLFPVIGVTLNLVGGTRTAWAERKAAPFTITPLRCGSAELNHPQIAAALKRLDKDATYRRLDFSARPVAGGWTDRRPSGAYAATRTYAGNERTTGRVDEQRSGLTLGTAMALSGATVSSSMGSRSSSAFSFLLTLFDLRLGMWLPNPAAVHLSPDRLAGLRRKYRRFNPLAFGPWATSDNDEDRYPLKAMLRDISGDLASKDCQAGRRTIDAHEEDESPEDAVCKIIGKYLEDRISKQNGVHSQDDDPEARVIRDVRYYLEIKDAQRKTREARKQPEDAEPELAPRLRPGARMLQDVKEHLEATADPDLWQTRSGATSPKEKVLQELEMYLKVGRTIQDVLSSVEEELNRPKPENTLRSLFDEMLGTIDDRGNALYLSDGGHFDNLGLYEMLRRRCRCILVIDASNDANHHFADLGSVIRRANIDLDACVEFDPVPKFGVGNLPGCGLYASISYPKRDNMPEACGELLVIKPWLPEDTPAEVCAYKAANPAFPHDSMADQFFSESQFESYRRLGEHVTAAVLGQVTDMRSLFNNARARRNAGT